MVTKGSNGLSDESGPGHPVYCELLQLIKGMSIAWIILKNIPKGIVEAFSCKPKRFPPRSKIFVSRIQRIFPLEMQRYYEIEEDFSQNPEKLSLRIHKGFL